MCRIGGKPGQRCELPFCTYLPKAHVFGRKRAQPSRPRRTAREQAYMDAHPVCEDCGRQRATHCHHVGGRGRGGERRDTARLRALDAACHERRHLFGEAEQEARLAVAG